MHLHGLVPNYKVYSLLKHVQIEGSVLDGCGSRGDAISHVLSERRCSVTTNDIIHM